MKYQNIKTELALQELNRRQDELQKAAPILTPQPVPLTPLKIENKKFCTELEKYK